MGVSRLDYRQILRTEIERIQESDPRRTQAYFARRIGVSRSYLSMVLKQKKHISIERLDRLARVLALDNSKVSQVLLSFHRQALKTRYLSQPLNSLCNLTQFQKQIRSRAPRDFSSHEEQLFKDELYSVLFALLPHIPNGDLVKVEQALCKLPYSKSEIAKAIRWLIEKGFISKDSVTGAYFAIDSYVRTQKPAKLGKYIPWFEKSLDALRNPSLGFPLRVQGGTFSFDSEQYAALMDSYGKFMMEIVEKSKNSKDAQDIHVIYFGHILLELAHMAHLKG